MGVWFAGLSRPHLSSLLSSNKLGHLRSKPSHRSSFLPLLISLLLILSLSAWLFTRSLPALPARLVLQVLLLPSLRFALHPADFMARKGPLIFHRVQTSNTKVTNRPQNPVTFQLDKWESQDPSRKELAVGK
jgi:hypothetical protein